MSFACERCGYHNNEIQSGAPIADKGIRITLYVKTEQDLNRQVVKSDYANVKIEDLDFEIPAKSQKGGKYIGVRLNNTRNLFFICRSDNDRGYN